MNETTTAATALTIPPIAKLGATAALLFAAWKWGSPEIKGAALGVAGVIAINQLPVIRDGAAVRLVA